MAALATPGIGSEEGFAALVDTLAADAARREELRDLLREEHPVYAQRGATAVARMRGWALLALARLGVSEAELVFVLEELDTGVDPYLVAAAARSLRSYPRPTAALAPFVMRALANVRFRDEPVSFAGYGEYALGNDDTSPVRELLLTLAWLGPHARGILPELESLHAERGGAFRKRAAEVERAVAAIRGGGGDETPAPPAGEECCALPAGLGGSWLAARTRGGDESIGTLRFEDQAGQSVTFDGLFRGHPSIVAFFYTRCDNPLKCSLTVSKLAGVQRLLAARGLDERIHTAAVTYDPAFDLPERLRGYGRNRGLRMDSRHRVVRAPGGIEALRRHFGLGVNFVESLVNRHRVEAFVLDRDGRVAAAFERLHWDEGELIERAVRVLDEADAPPPAPPAPPMPRRGLAPWIGTLAALGVALFPKCPICWAAYLSAFGVAGLGSIPYSPWLQPLLAVAMLVNLGSMWLRGRASGRMSPFWLAGAGALLLAAAKLGAAWPGVGLAGVAFTLAGSALSVALGGGRRAHVESGRRGWRRSAAAVAGS